MAKIVDGHRIESRSIKRALEPRSLAARCTLYVLAESTREQQLVRLLAYRSLRKGVTEERRKWHRSALVVLRGPHDGLRSHLDSVFRNRKPAAEPSIRCDRSSPAQLRTRPHATT